MACRSDENATLERFAALEKDAAPVGELERRIRELEQENEGLRVSLENAARSQPTVAAVPAATDLDAIYVDAKIHDYAAALAAATRSPGDVGLTAHAEHVTSGARPADAERLIDAARARAAEAQRKYVVPDDIRSLALDVLGPPLILSREAEGAGIEASAVLEAILNWVELR